MHELAIESVGLTKSYRVYESPWQRLREALTGRPTHREFTALSQVDFAVEPGEGIGIIGENGAGKSTLLKILAGVTQPTRGSVRVRGKVAAILELGSGFHPDFTGRQNIVLNAAMLGLGEREVRERTPEIIAWSELGDFIDQPVKTYSTGMAMRLGFAIATQVDPDVLIIDEALSVGDGYFQKKCMDKLVQLVGAGKTLLFCSHAMYYVSAFCRRALWLRNGRVEALGPVSEVVPRYEEFLVRKAQAAVPAEVESERPAPARLADVVVRGTAEDGTVAPGARIAVDVAWTSEPPAGACHVGIGVNRDDGVEVCSFATHVDGRPPLAPAAAGGRRSLRLEIPALPIVKGSYTVYVFLLDEAGLHIYDQRILPAAFRVVGSAYAFGIVDVPHAWHDLAAVPAAAPLSNAAAPAAVETRR